KAVLLFVEEHRFFNIITNIERPISKNELAL
ncbi:MAG: hypothetical protein ACI8YQ_005233, partial [Polaribacter sp.]